MLAYDCAIATLKDVLKTGKFPQWHFLDIHSEDIDSRAFGKGAEVKHVYFLGGITLPRGNVEIRVTVYHPHGDVWYVHDVELRTWSETQKKGEGGLALFSTTEIRKLFAQ